MMIEITDEMIRAGEDIDKYLIDAHLAQVQRTEDKYDQPDYKSRYEKLLQELLATRARNVRAIYIAMERAK